MLETNEQNDKIVAKISGTDRLNAANAPEVKSKLNDVLAVSGAKKVVLNLENIRFIDSTGIGALISALKTARQNEQNFQLCALQKDVLNLLTLMKLDKVFDITPEGNQCQ
jgi:anti-sigma B factor antagonist